METPLIIIALAAFITALLTFFSGFGLGTILTPVFVLFFPVEMAIALTGTVHFLNNIFKLALIGKHANAGVILRFGIPAIIAALGGAWLLMHLSELEAWFTYSLMGKSYSITPVRLIIAVLLLFFAFTELVPLLKSLKINKKALMVGGAFSGFFGGLSGHQGALRSIFLIKLGLSKEAFIATGVVIACFIDISRLSVYYTGMDSSGLLEEWPAIVTAALSAFTGAFMGKRLLKKLTLSFIQKLVAFLMMAIAVGLGMGVI